MIRKSHIDSVRTHMPKVVYLPPSYLLLTQSITILQLSQLQKTFEENLKGGKVKSQLMNTEVQNWGSDFSSRGGLILFPLSLYLQVSISMVCVQTGPHTSTKSLSRILGRV